MELYALGLLDALKGIRERRFSSEDLTRACLARAERLEGKIKAWEWLDPEFALQCAREADRQLEDGLPMGGLHGIPVGMKDIISTKGMPTSMGSPIYAGNVPSQSATVVQHLQAAGAFVMGKTVTTEFAWRHPGKTHNPWNLGHTPGGSSSGSAAAVAAGCVPAAFGTQTVGSVIRPAAYCGVVGYKPSYGLISRTGVHPLSPTLDHVGVFARSIGDAAFLASCLTGYDRSDPQSLLVNPLQACSGDVTEWDQPPRLAAIQTPVWDLADDVQKAMFKKNVEQLAEAGAVVHWKELPNSFDNALDVLRTILFAEGAQIYAPLQAQYPGKTSKPLDSLIETGLKISAVQYMEALKAAEEMRAQLEDFFGGFDGIVTPPATGEAPKTLGDTGDASFCGIWTLMGVPTISFPVGHGPNGLPLGLQVVGPYLNDSKALKVATWCNRQIEYKAGFPLD